MEFSVIESSYYIDTVLRVIIAVILGFAIGFEREITSKFAGLRTHILVCVGSCIFTILSIYVFPTFAAEGNYQAYGDPARIAAQVLTGIGFIGGGTVLRNGSSVFGLTTAATLWITASIGMAVGCGSVLLATVATLITLIILIVIRKLETNFLHKFTQKTAVIKATVIVSPENVAEVIRTISTRFDKVIQISHTKAENPNEKEKVYVVSKVVSQNPVLDMYNQVMEIDKVEDVFITNMNFDK